MSGVLLWLVVGVLGGVGAVARYAVQALVDRGAFPAGTLAVNLSGSVVLGVLAGFARRGDALLLAGTALLGSYTTFSTWMAETHGLSRRGERALAVANLVLSLILGLAAVALGRALSS